jgi:predicted GIY-YIG superfamily endonuclease
MTQTALYRHFSKSGQLLYVGVSRNPFDRLAEHIRRGHWTTEISAITLQWFESEDEALSAEHLAIKTERPLWNATAKRGGNGGRPLNSMRHLTAEATRPWEYHGMSRTTWYRHKRNAGNEPGDVVSKEDREAFLNGLSDVEREIWGDPSYWTGEQIARFKDAAPLKINRIK